MAVTEDAALRRDSRVSTPPGTRGSNRLSGLYMRRLSDRYRSTTDLPPAPLSRPCR
jgi:hypothetical protein